MQRLLLPISVLLISTFCTAQTPVTKLINTDSLSNTLFVTVVDVINRTDIDSFQVHIIAGSDTTAIHHDSAGIFTYALIPGQKYEVRLTRTGYQAQTVSWDQPEKLADAYLDFYLWKEDMTRADRKQARIQSQQPIYRTTGHDGGFESMFPKKCILEYQLEVYYKNGSIGSASYSK